MWVQPSGQFDRKLSLYFSADKNLDLRQDIIKLSFNLDPLVV